MFEPAVAMITSQHPSTDAFPAKHLPVVIPTIGTSPLRRAKWRKVLVLPAPPPTPALGVPPARHWDLPDGDLPEHQADLTARIVAVMREVQPRTLYSFHAGEAHRDHRAIAAATAAAAHALSPECRCLLYGVNFVPPGGTLFDTTDMYARNYRALQAYGSQNAYIDLPGMSEHRERAATVNLDIPGVLYGEMFLDLLPHELVQAHALQDRFFRFIQRETP